MSSDRQGLDGKPEVVGTGAIERREALIKLGKYAAYAPPLLIGSVDAAHAFFNLEAPPPPAVLSGPI